MTTLINAYPPKVTVSKPYKTIIYEKKPPIAYVTLNRPEKMNAISWDMRDELRDALTDAGWEDKEIKVVVLKGEGRCFSAGWDLADPKRPADASLDAEARFALGKHMHSVIWHSVWDNPLPIIAQVHGFCLAAGMAFASNCQLCYCSEDALFGYPIVRDSGPFLAVVSPYLIGMRKVNELLYTGNLIDAQEAYKIGFVNKVVPQGKLEDEVNKMARTLVKFDRAQNINTKRTIHMFYELMNMRTAHERADENEVLPGTSPRSYPSRAEFRRIMAEQGLKAALDWRYKRFAEEDAWWIEREKARKL